MTRELAINATMALPATYQRNEWVKQLAGETAKLSDALSRSLHPVMRPG